MGTKLKLSAIIVSLLMAFSANSQCVDAGDDEYKIVCLSEVPFAVSGYVTPGDDFIWYTDGTGTFEDEYSLNTVYHPSPEDLKNGVAIGLYNYDCGLGDGIYLDYFNIDAGPDLSVCSSGSTSLRAKTLGGAHWVSSGTGSFADPYSSATTYSPSASDIANGSVTINVSAYDYYGNCPDVNDEVVLAIVNSSSTLEAGYNQYLDPLGNTLTATSSGVSSILWTTQGTGTFDDPTSLHAVYNPSQQDFTNGYDVVLTLTGDAGGCQISDMLYLDYPIPLSINHGNSSSSTDIKNYHVVSVAPNPAITYAEIKLDKDFEGAVDVKLFNAAGIEVYSQKDYVVEGSLMMNKLDDLKEGVYKVMITGSQAYFTARLVKQ